MITSSHNWKIGKSKPPLKPWNFTMMSLFPMLNKGRGFLKRGRRRCTMVASAKLKHVSTQHKVPFQACYHCGATGHLANSHICKMQKHRNRCRHIGHLDFMHQLSSQLAKVGQVYDDNSSWCHSETTVCTVRRHKHGISIFVEGQPILFLVDTVLPFSFFLLQALALSNIARCSVPAIIQAKKKDPRMLCWVSYAHGQECLHSSVFWCWAWIALQHCKWVLKVHCPCVSWTDFWHSYMPSKLHLKHENHFDNQTAFYTQIRWTDWSAHDDAHFTGFFYWLRSPHLAPPPVALTKSKSLPTKFSAHCKTG